MALNVIVAALGSGPALTTNSSNSPGLIAVAALSEVQSISDTACATRSPSSVVTGWASRSVLVVKLHPGCGRTSTDANGVSVGNCSLNPVVLAVSLSVGTWNVSTASPPCVASGELTVTWAYAGAASASHAATTPAATTGRRIDFDPFSKGGSWCRRRRSRTRTSGL